MNCLFRSKKTVGFGQLRFVVAAVLFFAAGLKVHQLATIPLPPQYKEVPF
jgi:hypothetical protein